MPKQKMRPVTHIATQINMHKMYIMYISIDDINTFELLHPEFDAQAPCLQNVHPKTC